MSRQRLQQLFFEILVLFLFNFLPPRLLLRHHPGPEDLRVGSLQRHLSAMLGEVLHQSLFRQLRILHIRQLRILHFRQFRIFLILLQQPASGTVGVR